MAVHKHSVVLPKARPLLLAIEAVHVRSQKPVSSTSSVLRRNCVYSRLVD